MDYKTCRKKARLTQEQAAEQLYISRRTISAYENFSTQVSDNMVVAMAVLYKQPELIKWHLLNRTPYSDYICGRWATKQNHQCIMVSEVLEKIMSVLNEGDVIREKE